MWLGLARSLGSCSIKACRVVGLLSFSLPCRGPRVSLGVNFDWRALGTTPKKSQPAAFFSTSPLSTYQMQNTMADSRIPAGTLQSEKLLQRKLVKKELRSLSTEEKAQEDEAIQMHVLGADWFQRCQKICAYISCPALREVGTGSIVEHLLQKQGKALYVPRVEDKESHMRMLRITSLEADMVANTMNILEPTPLNSQGQPREDVMDAEEPVDLILLPGLAFDRFGGRLGRGGGYYDLFLETYMKHCKSKGWQTPLLVALAYQVQIVDDALPMDESDVYMHGFVTSQGFIDVKGQSLKE